MEKGSNEKYIQTFKFVRITLKERIRRYYYFVFDLLMFVLSGICYDTKRSKVRLIWTLCQSMIKFFVVIVYMITLYK